MPVKYTQTFRAPTEYERQLEEARRRAMLAEALAQQQYEPMEGNAAPIPKAAPLVKALQSFMTARAGRQAEEAKAAAEKAGRTEFADYIRSFEPEQRNVNMAQLTAMEAPMPMINTEPGGSPAVPYGQSGFRSTEYAQPSAVAAPNQRLMPVMGADGQPDFSQPMQMQVGGPLTAAQKRARALEGFESSNPMVQQFAMSQYEATMPKTASLKIGDIDPSKFTPASVADATRTGDISKLVAIEKPAESMVGKPSPADFTPASIAKFSKTGNYADLVAVPKPAPVTNIDLGPKDTFKLEADLRGEVKDKLKDYEAVRSSYQKIENALKTGAGDIAVVYAFAKLNDPTSVVRESEFATVAKSGSLGQRIKNLVEQAQSGKMNPELRENLRQQARQMYLSQQANAESIVNQYRDLAGTYKLDPNKVLAGININNLAAKEDEDVIDLPPRPRGRGR
jgi:hypothetical protein